MTQCRTAFILVFALLLSACSSAKGPAPGTPEWLYAAARDSFTAGDFEKAADHLEKIERTGNNAYVQRARAWRLILTAGLANAYLELAQAYADGWSQARANRTAFLRQKTEYLKQARRHAIRMLEAYGAFVKDSADKPVVLEFPFPKGSAGQVAELDRVYKGMATADGLRATAQEKMLNRGLVRSVSTVLTTEEDAAGAQNVLKSGRAEAPPAKFLLVMGSALFKLSTIFERKNLDEIDTLKMCHERAQDAVKRVLELKPGAATETAARKLQADVEKAAKAATSKIRIAAR